MRVLMTVRPRSSFCTQQEPLSKHDRNRHIRRLEKTHFTCCESLWARCSTNPSAVSDLQEKEDRIWQELSTMDPLRSCADVGLAQRSTGTAPAMDMQSFPVRLLA